MIIYPTNKDYMLLFQQNDNILNDENKKYISNLKDSLKNKTGKGIVNKALHFLPEMHISLPKDVSSENVLNGSFNNTGKYSFCGPGTRVQKRIKEGYKGVNSLDKECKKHDIFYSQKKKTKERNIADDILAQAASKIALDPMIPEYEKKDAKLVTGIMGMKSHFGMGSKNLKKPSMRAKKK